MRILNQVKKLIVLMAAVLAVASVSNTSLLAQTPAPDYLKIIADNTTAILKNVSDLPTYLKNWTSNDDSANPVTIATMQTNFVNLSNAYVNNSTAQISQLPNLQTVILGPSASPTALPNANDLYYGTLLGSLFYNPDPRAKTNKQAAANAPFNYIQNAAGILSPHTIPSPGWQGSLDDQNRYIAYYNAVTSVESYNAYLMSGIYADFANKNAYTEAQAAILQQATQPAWFTQIKSESIGFVLRQMLVYQSQLYVLFSQMLDMQKKMLTAQAMTNTLLIINNQFNEQNMVKRASTVMVAQ